MEKHEHEYRDDSSECIICGEPIELEPEEGVVVIAPDGQKINAVGQFLEMEFDRI